MGQGCTRAAAGSSPVTIPAASTPAVAHVQSKHAQSSDGTREPVKAAAADLQGGKSLPTSPSSGAVKHSTEPSVSRKSQVPPVDKPPTSKTSSMWSCFSACSCTSSNTVYPTINAGAVDLTHFDLLKVVGKGGFGRVNAGKVDSSLRLRWCACRRVGHVSDMRNGCCDHSGEEDGSSIVCAEANG